ncbi:ATP-binding protein [Agaribacterium sp. ZY112]|uniref:ATP-binding protein n=1 Tax=Agaribacterium sp. ZY112 TaxID=3233574 RepID=UPI0035257398
MTKLFFRFYLGAVLACAVSLTAATLYLSDFYTKTEAKAYLRMTLGLQKSIVSQAQLHNTAPDFSDLENDYPFLISEIDLNTLPDDVRKGLQQNSVHVALRASLFQSEVDVYYPSYRENKALVFEPNTNFDQPYNQMLLTLLVFTLLGLALMMFYLIQPIKRQLKDIANIAQEIGQGRFNNRANESAPAPINQLASSINKMSDQLQKLLEDKKVMMGAAAHELRTPLARLRFALDIARSDTEPTNTIKQLEAMDPDLDQLESLIDEILLFSKLSFETSKPDCKKINIRPELERLIEERAVFYPKLNIDLNVPVNTFVYADRSLFLRAFSNILNNALHYSKQQLSITCLESTEHINIYVEDDGPGLATHLYKQVLRPFFRADQSRNANHGNSGLGLAIVNNIMDLHSGTISLEKSELGGLKISLQWPLTDTDNKPTTQEQK